MKTMQINYHLSFCKYRSYSYTSEYTCLSLKTKQLQHFWDSFQVIQFSSLVQWLSTAGIHAWCPTTAHANTLANIYNRWTGLVGGHIHHILIILPAWQKLAEQQFPRTLHLPPVGCCYSGEAYAVINCRPLSPVHWCGQPLHYTYHLQCT